jgi:SRSO17 transposase
MNRTYTPDLAPDVLDRLADYADGFRDDFDRPRQAAWCGVYLRGLIQDGDRKSVEPMAARVPLPPGLDVADPDQALQQFLGQSTWGEQAVLRRYRATMARQFADPAAVSVIDDTTFPNCQCAVSVHYVSPKGHYPLDMRLYLPESWLGDPKRLGRAEVPEGERRPLTKGQIALERLDRARGEGLPGGLVVADGGYGASGPSRAGLEQRGLHYIVGVTDEMVVFAEEPRWIEPAAATGGRPRKRHRLAEDSPRPVGLKERAARAPRREVTWREGTKGPLWGRSAWLRVWPGQGWAAGQCASAGPIRLPIEEQADGKSKYAFSNLPAGTSRLRAVRLWRSRGPVGQGYQQRKEEPGLDHHEGRSWRGFHHHDRLVMPAFGFLTLERRRARRGRSRPGKEGGAEGR